MGCNANSGGRQVDIPKNLMIHGSVIDNQTRSLMAACAYSNQQFSLQEIDTLKGDNR